MIKSVSCDPVTTNLPKIIDVSHASVTPYCSGLHNYFHESCTYRRKYQKLHPVINSMSVYQSVIPEHTICIAIQRGLFLFKVILGIFSILIIFKYYLYYFTPDAAVESESDMTYNQVWWPILGICALHLTHPRCTHTQQWTHTHTHTHTPWTPGAVGALLKAPNPSIEGGESAVHSLPPPTIPAGPRFELAEITSPTL